MLNGWPVSQSGVIVTDNKALCPLIPHSIRMHYCHGNPRGQDGLPLLMMMRLARCGWQIEWTNTSIHESTVGRCLSLWPRDIVLPGQAGRDGGG